MRVRSSGGKSGEAYTKPKAADRPKLKAAPETREYTLPDPDDDDSAPALEFGQTNTLFHGEYKVGKTLTAMCCPDPLLLAFEPGGSAISPNRQREIASWTAYRAYIKLLKSSDRFQTLVVDTADAAYDLCFKAMCKQEGVDHPSEGDFGNVWTAIRNEFESGMMDLMRLGRGVIFISHTETAQFMSRTGGTYNKLIPSMGKRAREYITSVVDSSLFFGYHGEERLITLQGSDDLEAGTRLRHNFWVKGREPQDWMWESDDIPEDQMPIRVHSIPMGRNERESYRNLIRAFNNEQEDEHRPEVERIVLAETKAPPRRRGGR